MITQQPGAPCAQPPASHLGQAGPKGAVEHEVCQLLPGLQRRLCEHLLVVRQDPERQYNLHPLCKIYDLEQVLHLQSARRYSRLCKLIKQRALLR